MLYGRITGLLFSLFLPAFYRAVARNWGGIGLLYVLLLFTIAWMPRLVIVGIEARNFADVEFPKFANKLPDVTMKNGKLSSPVAQPLELDDKGALILVFDTTGKIKNLEQ